MVKYKVNLKFNESGLSLNETITSMLKIELENRNTIANNISKRKEIVISDS